jgi:hypothetical protein
MQKLLNEWRKYLAEQDISQQPAERTTAQLKPAPTVLPRPTSAERKRMKAETERAIWLVRGGYSPKFGWSPASKGHAQSSLSPIDFISPNGAITGAGVALAKAGGAKSVAAIFSLFSLKQLKHLFKSSPKVLGKAVRAREAERAALSVAPVTVATNPAKYVDALKNTWAKGGRTGGKLDYEAKQVWSELNNVISGDATRVELENFQAISGAESLKALRTWAKEAQRQLVQVFFSKS